MNYEILNRKKLRFNEFKKQKKSDFNKSLLNLYCHDFFFFVI